MHSLDMNTVAKREFLSALDEMYPAPRGLLDYRVQFPGPGRHQRRRGGAQAGPQGHRPHEVICFTNGFHGMTLGSLAVTGNRFHRAAAGVPLTNATPMPYDGYLDDRVTGLPLFDACWRTGQRPGRPAAVIVETVQGEGGVNVARPEWLRGLAGPLCRRTRSC